MSFKILILSTLLFFHIGIYAQDANTRTFEQVKNEFVKKYVYESYEKSLGFAKKNKDWYIVMSNYADREEIEEYLFWNSREGRFEPVSFAPNTKGRQSNAYNASVMNAYYYSFMPYYGYSGYYADNIRYLGNKPGKSDDELYCLARAYSEYAGNLLSNQYGTGLDKYSFKKYFCRQNSLSKEELKTFSAYHDSCLSTYAALVARLPSYNTHIVGSAANKMYNEYMYRYMTLCMYMNDSIALAGLPHDLYNDFTLGYAKNFLDACAPNAILFVEGDNDTYPMLYYQQSRNYRKDITIVNVSLLGTEIYPNYLNDTRQVPLSFSFDEQHKKAVLYTQLESESEKVLSLQAYMALLKDTLKEINFYGQYPGLNCKEITISGRYDTIHIPVKRVLYRSDNLILDILNTQLGKRPISIAVWTDPTGLLSSLLPYSSYNGFVYNLEGPVAKRDKQANLAALVKRLTDTAYYHIPETPERSDAFVPNSYKVLLTQVIALCLEAKDNAGAKALVDFYFKYIPFASFSPCQQDLAFIFYYKDIYDVTTARALLGILAKEVRKGDYINDAQRMDFEEQIMKTLEVLRGKK